MRSVDLDLVSGEAVALFGANGSGKTTLLRLVATLVRPTTGDGRVLEADLRAPMDVEMIRPHIGLVGHEPALYPSLTLRENLELWAGLYEREATRVDAALETVGLTGAADRPVGRSSNGMRRRLEFARVLLIHPRLLLLDEAHVGLDPEAWSLVGHLVRTVIEPGGGALLVAHERELVKPLVQRSVVLAEGRLEAA